MYVLASSVEGHNKCTMYTLCIGLICHWPSLSHELEDTMDKGTPGPRPKLAKQERRK